MLASLSCDESLIVVSAEQTFYVVSVSGLDLDEPPLTIGIAVDQLGAVFELAVDFEDFPFDREEEVRYRLYSFDRAKDFFCAEAFTFGRDVYIDDFAELTLSVVRDTYVDNITFEACPFVVLGVPQFLWNVHVLSWGVIKLVDTK
jgi:hypothetical protein